ncbi:hypothetical protein PV08_04068 [Exophiala spinifera]|uniref:Uncharacterized protein n=1 Tax=Exophiala spinifera TaxID=91928 RepID=A0A0D2BD31_9EURO|nr:uncharacterized protein PV08_04068 [Exophiala spinifera]KIW16878.1 hypothetical protein PV08_04068 [Exophiala spinifera]
MHEDSKRKGGLCPLDFALGWPAGLKTLLRFGHDPRSALELSIYFGDLESTRILLGADGFALAINPLIVHGASVQEIQEIQECVIDALKAKREQLRTIGLENSAAGELQLSDFLGQETVPNPKGVVMWNDLRRKGVEVRRELFPGRATTVFAYLDSESRLDFAERLYNAGFESVDGAEKTVGTPLLNLVSQTSLGTGSSYDLVAWLLKKQASPYFGADGSFPSMLFYFAILYDSLRSDQRFSTEILPLTSSLCNPMCTDDCSCYCSSLGGCLPAHKLWTCDPCRSSHGRCQSTNRAVLSLRLQEWLIFSQLDELVTSMYLDEICRLEIFDRLGLAHTCCTAFGGLYVKRKTVDEEKRMELHDEDAVLIEQLELIMQEYKRLKGGCTETLLEFWGKWWARIDMILPELSPKERCRRKSLERDFCHFNDDLSIAEFQKEAHKLSELRAATEENALRNLGYYGWDFSDVIRTHLRCL